MQSEDIVISGKWSVRHLSVTPDKISLIWDMMQKHRTLFSDLTRDDRVNFVNAILSPDSMWYEVHEYDSIVGLIWFEGLHNVIDYTVHLVFFDRRPSEKLELCRKMIYWIFDNTAINRITVTPPAIYKRTIKLLVQLGFTYEGKRREALLMGGNWIDQLIYGITRTEVMKHVGTNRQDRAAV